MSPDVERGGDRSDDGTGSAEGKKTDEVNATLFENP